MVLLSSNLVVMLPSISEYHWGLWFRSR